jgi:hypothetical protein
MVTTSDAYLSADRVRSIYAQCFRPEGSDSPRRVMVEGWLAKHTFAIAVLHKYREDIIRMLLSLPAGFRADVLEGGSVGLMIRRGDGTVWSAEMSDIEKLVALGIASGLMTFNAPRDKWHRLPGGLPYVRIEITRFGVSVN